jgi:hypothetical protein
MDHSEIIKLIVAYTITGAFVCTVVFTLLSMVGLIKFVDPTQQNKLFYTLIVEIVVASVGYYADLLHYDPHQTINQIVTKDHVQLIDDAPPPVAWALRKMSEDDLSFFLLRGANNCYFIDPKTEDPDEKRIVEDLTNYGLFKVETKDKSWDGMNTCYQATDYGKSVWDFLTDYLVTNTFGNAKKADAILNKPKNT